MEQLDKNAILNKLCYTELVYERIKKKLSLSLSKKEIEVFIFDIIKATPTHFFVKTGKNIYVRNNNKGIQITINFNTTRIITVDIIK